VAEKLVGIVTLVGDTNYGNRLQNYALQEAIKSLGSYRVETLEGLPLGESKPLKIRRLLATAFGRRKEIIRRLVNRTDAHPTLDDYVCPPARRAAIQAFSDHYITPAPQQYSTEASNSALIDRYHRFVVGSDQVWNPAYTHANPEWFLSFARPEQRVAYAASIGIPELPKYLRSKYRRGFNLVENLSVREHQAAKTINELTGKNPPVVLDPTMLLTREQWDLVAVEPPQLQPPSYVATFMLSAGDATSIGGPDLTAVHQYAQSECLGIVDLHSPEDPDSIAFGPSEFIGAIRGAKLLVTDSFHAAVFASLFHVPFLLVPRGAMNSRFETLLAHTGLSNRLLSEASDVQGSLQIDWGTVDARIAEKREESISFLARSLGQ